MDETSNLPWSDLLTNARKAAMPSIFAPGPPDIGPSPATWWPMLVGPGRSGPMANPEVAATVKALSQPQPFRIVSDAPVRLPHLKNNSNVTGYDIYQGENPIGFSAVERTGPGEHYFHYLGAGKPNPLGAEGQHSPGTLGYAGQRDVLQQIRKSLQQKFPNDPWPKMDGYRESGAAAFEGGKGRNIKGWRLPLVVGGVPMMAHPQEEDQ